MAETPPNLRYSDCERDCGDCGAFKKQAQACGMFSDYPVAPELICDKWVSKDAYAKKDHGQGS